ncbi:P-loop containing nucleoside triphosphate hydrolase protein, partial [Mycena alexandri]
IETTFGDVYIEPEIMDILQTAVMYPILYPEEYTTGILAQESMGGVLLFGPPGTGKTMACRALAKESGARMLQLPASTVQNQAVGQTEKLILAAFSLARRLGPCIMFIDELDALFCKRDKDSKPWHRTMVTEFTQAMDGLTTAAANQRAGLVVVGATNRPQDIDTAVMRRLSRRILVDLPTVKQRKVIINHYLKDERYDEKTVNVANLAYCTESFSGSDLRHLVFCAALAALKDIMVPHSADIVPRPQSSGARRYIQGKHFDRALKQLATCSGNNRKDLDELRRWAKQIQ